ncbi:MAG TPA: FAD-dependent monooxygenase [Beijerinckiaceae bacterium]|nr:FAD-dependent monooxygenase [Beijerinckiaceae bacterium]
MTPGIAVVAGAGIGGLTAALALAARGWEVTLVERRTAFSTDGAGIQLSPNASRILIDLGLGPALRRAASEPARVAIRALASGREIGAVALGAFMRERFGAPYYVVHRAELQTLLLDAVRARATIRLMMGRAVIGGRERPDGTSITVENAAGARDTLEADLAVAADGLWSRLRAAGEDWRAPQYRGFAAWRATIPCTDAPAGLVGDETGLWLGRDRHVVHYPIAGGRLLNIVAVERRAAPVEGWAEPGDRAELVAAFAAAAAPLRALVAAAPAWQLWSLFDLPAAAMRRGRLALVGDAAHPVLPFLAQGGALAIEDAAVLAGVLAGAKDVAAALAGYERARLPRARRIQQAARRNGAAYHAGGVKAFIRDAVIRQLGPERMALRFAWLYGWRAE